MASGWSPSLADIGAAPSDGDFARLLEAASEPAAHRMATDPAVTRFGGRTGRTAGGTPWGPPGMVRETAAPPTVAHAQAARVDTAHVENARPRLPSASFGRSSPLGRGSVAGTPLAAALEPLAGAVASGAGLVEAFRRRPLRDQVVFALLAFAVLWMLVAIVSALLGTSGADLGSLAGLALIAFLLLRGRSRKHSSDPS